MSDELKAAMRTVVDYLDQIMQDNPSRELADVSNYLEGMLKDGA